MPEHRLRIRALRCLDGIAGRAACAALTVGRGAPPGEPVDAERVRRVLVIRPGGLGDAIHLIPLLQALRTRFHPVALDLLMERRNSGLVDPTLADSVFLYDRRAPRELWAALRGGYDVVIDTEQWYYLSAIIARLTRAPVRCGFDTNRRGRLFTHPVAYDESGYEARVFLSLYEALTGEVAVFDEGTAYLTLDPADRRWADSALRSVARSRLLVMAPAAPTRERQWEPRRYAEVVARFAKDGWAIVLVGTSADRPLCAAVADELRNHRVLDLTGRTTIRQTAAVISRAAVYLSSDGGLLHAAHALGIPTVGLFGAGIATKWAPRGAHARTVRHALPCSPCTRFGYAPPCPYGVACMERITVEEVVTALEEIQRDAAPPAAVDAARHEADS